MKYDPATVQFAHLTSLKIFRPDLGSEFQLVYFGSGGINGSDVLSTLNVEQELTDLIESVQDTPAAAKTVANFDYKTNGDGLITEVHLFNVCAAFWVDGSKNGMRRAFVTAPWDGASQIYAGCVYQWGFHPFMDPFG